MANTKDSRRLDDLIKQTLNNYEDASAASDWSKMEGLLGVVPKSTGSNFQLPSFSLEGAGLVKRIFSSYIFIIGLMLAGGGYLLYTILKAPKADTTVNTVLPVADTLTNKPVQPATVPAALPPENNTVVETKKEEAKDTVATVKAEPSKAEKAQAAKEAKEKEEKLQKEKKEAELAEKKRLEKEKAEADKLKASEKKREEKKEEARKAEKRDKEREKERALKAEKEKKAASKETLKKSNNPIGLSNFLRSVNVDSLKKQQNQEQPAPQQQPKDSVKTQ